MLLQGTDATASIAHVIQLAIAPVFLLSGIGAMLGVLTNRLSRIVDRARGVEGALPKASPSDAPHMHAELRLLSRRAKLVNRAITLCTMTALLIASVIALLFLGAFLDRDVAVAIAWLFVTAMVALVAALVLFLREIFMATHTLRFDPK